MTNGELVSRIVNDIRALNKDEHVSRRYILSIARNKAKFLLAQKLRDRSLFREDNLFNTIRCFQLKKEDIVRCNVVEFKRCDNLMKSVKKLPELIYSRYGSSVVSITTIDGMERFFPVTLAKYSLNKKRRFSKYVNQKYYYIKDGYLYLPDVEIEVVDVTLITLENDLIETLSDCGNVDDNNGCDSVWEYDFICSDKLLEAVIQDTLQEVMSTYKRITPDENPNLDETQRGKTII